MKTHTKTLLTALAASACATASHAATLNIITTTPPTNVLISQTNKAKDVSFNSTDVTGVNFVSLVGQTFKMPEIVGSGSQYSVTGITVQKRETSTYVANSSLTFWVFEWPTTDANSSSGWGTATDDGIGDQDPFDGTSVSNILVNGESSSIAGETINNDDYLNFSFDTALTLDENKAYGFLVGFKGLATTGGVHKDRFRLRQSNIDLLGPDAGGQYYGDGRQLVVNTANGFGNIKKDMTFWVQGTAVVVPEPGSLAMALIGLGGLAMRRRRG